MPIAPLIKPPTVAYSGGGVGGSPYRTNSGGSSGAGGVRAYSPAYGGVPILPSSNNLYSNLNGILNQAIPGFNSLTSKSSGIIGNALNGELPRDVQNQITDAAATQAVRGGMPGSNGTSGTLYGNRTLRDLGLTSLNRQDTGVKDLIGFLQGVSGTAAPNYQQVQGQENAIQQYAAAPEPAAAAKEQQNLYEKYSNPAAGTVPQVAAGGGGNGMPWWAQSQPGGGTTIGNGWGGQTTDYINRLRYGV